MQISVDNIDLLLPYDDFDAGYIKRALDILPKQGSEKPWRVYQNYFMDMLTIRHGKIDDGVLKFRT
jgi:cyclohexanone monooxygenase